jgi:integrase
MADRLLRDEGTFTRFVFFHPTHGRYGGRDLKAGRRITASGWDKAWKAARIPAGCPKLIPHDFRRTAARRFAQLGIPQVTSMGMLGHKTDSIYRRYAITNATDQREAARKLDAASASVTANCDSGPSGAASKPLAVQNA